MKIFLNSLDLSHEIIMVKNPQKVFGKGGQNLEGDRVRGNISFTSLPHVDPQCATVFN